MEPRLRAVRILVLVFIAGLVISGVTAIPLVAEVNALVQLTDAHSQNLETGITKHHWAVWLTDLQAALVETRGRFPFLFYGTDWLAFGHIVIAVAFIGAWRDPIRNAWLFDFGLIACALVIPWAFVFGEIRGIPVWWRLIDGMFGLVGAIPLWWCRKTIRSISLQKPISA